MELDDVVLYQDDSGASDMMSERVSGLASSIYQEFERLIGRYDEDVVKQLMPLVVAVLENLDSVFSINQEHEVELELLKEDNEQLVTQYEREKALRKHTEERYIVLEDSQDGEKKELQSRLVLLESHTRQMELKARNYADQINRLEEREAELKKEFTSLHQRHTEMIHSYMEHLERTKHQHATAVTPSEPADTGPRARKERPISGGIFPLPGTDSVTSDLQRDVPESPSQPWRFAGQSQPRCNASLQDELSHVPLGPGVKGEPSSPGSKPRSARLPPDGSPGKASTPGSERRGLPRSPGVPRSPGPSRSPGVPRSPGVHRSRQDPTDDRTAGLGVTHASVHAPGSASTSPPSAAGAMGVAMETASASLKEGAPGEGVTKDLGLPGKELDGRETAEEEGGIGPAGTGRGGLEPAGTSQGGLGPDGSGQGGLGPTGSGQGRPEAGSPSDSADLALADGEDQLEKSEVQAIIESTPELDMEMDGFRDTSTPTKGIGGVENLALDRNTESLFEELSSCAGNDLIGDMDDGADLLGMGREVEHLIQENTQLLETKNALNVVKNDLIAQVDELACLREGLQSELEAVSQAKARVEDRNKELEEDLKKLRAELEEAKQKTKSDNGEDQSDVPTAQRKRFTRVEMARVLMERNQYKERLMELQEAVRWAEMIRQSKENPALTEKKKSSLWQLSFSRLFSSSGGAGKKPAGDAPVNLKYNAPSAQVQPTVKKKSSALQQLPSDKSKAFDFLNEEAAADPAVSRREQKRAQYQQVKDHVQKEDGRVQAYGWSLPHKYKVANGGQSETKMRNLPIPVFLRPLDEKNTSMKLWCAAGVNLSGGKTRDGGSIVGASVFYSSAPGPPPPRRRTGSQSSLDKLDQELEDQQEELRQTDEFSSLVWICTSTQSSTQSSTRALVIDANQPGHVLDNFPVCDSHVVCIASVPGARETDYPAGELVPLNSEAGPVEDNGSASLNASTNSVGENGEGVLGGITVVGCDAEGAAAIRQTAGSTAETSGDEDTRPIEEAGEASESCTGPSGRSKGPRGAYTEHIFADPLGAQKTDLPAGYTQRETDLVKDGLGPSAGPTGEEEQDLKLMEEAQKMTSVLPTMWLGAQNGCVYVHSSVARWKKCLHWIKLKDAVQGIVHVKGRVLVGLSDGTLAIFQRGADGQWDLSNYHLLDLGRPHHAVRCMAVVHDRVWCGLSNKIYVVQPEAMRVEKSFDAHPRKESQVRQLARDGDGIWVSIRLDSTLRLFHAHTHQHLQDVDIEPYVSKMLGTGKLGFSFVRITALMVSCNRLWIGTGNGVIMSVPLTETSEANQALVPAGAGQQQPTGGAVVRVYGDAASDKVTAGTFVPYCSMANAQLCFHGHRDAVKFFTAVPGHPNPPPPSEGGAAGGGADGPSQDGPGSMLVMSGGEGYIDFRMGDVAEEGEEPRLTLQPLQASAESSHLIVWQVLPHST
ncbi:C-Jun-amino-terminal kinase-interacting protein 4 isoform X2 [Gadus morhua]|uniref:C-Jun-amino-terminal kinase-interacting protein 4 isoform X2 n=1 Tax=Gadus morhua TaxID=8049 RepID=UPI0011B3AA8C|nr:C-Jun-amino-terminal kinase-interacting protein 4-like isoform X2 [Gadus morhua]